MKTIYNNIIDSIKNREKLLAVLIDPDKMTIEMAFGFIENVNKSIVTHIFIGGSSVERPAHWAAIVPRPANHGHHRQSVARPHRVGVPEVYCTVRWHVELSQTHRDHRC